MKQVDIYTDGACSGNPGKGGWGTVLLFNKNEKIISGFEYNTTNNKMELMAVLKGLQALKEPCEVIIYSDSAYVVNAINQNWLTNWKQNDWKNYERKPVKNVELWQELDTLLNYHSVKFVKVRGHSGNKYNEICDRLARRAIKGVTSE